MTEKGEKKAFDKELDTRGLFCPEPLFEVRNTSETLEKGQILKVLADDPAAEEDFKRWAKRTGTELLDLKKEKNEFIFYFRIIN
ncbi:MAG: sulfurtransferase TusA family protein [Promethearchaeia archaeon]